MVFISPVTFKRPVEVIEIEEAAIPSVVTFTLPPIVNAPTRVFEPTFDKNVMLRAEVIVGFPPPSIAPLNVMSFVPPVEVACGLPERVMGLPKDRPAAVIWPDKFTTVELS